jgi:hypothetical protein
MAIYHLSVKAVSRSAGRSATAAAAYRAGCEITDTRTGEVHDYTRKGGVESADLVLPGGAPEWAADRAALWNAAEHAERRKDACVAREYEVALPSNCRPLRGVGWRWTSPRRWPTAKAAPSMWPSTQPSKEGDERNHHATSCARRARWEAEGWGRSWTRRRPGGIEPPTLRRYRWAELTNERLREHGIEAR